MRRRRWLSLLFINFKSVRVDRITEQFHVLFTLLSVWISGCSWNLSRGYSRWSGKLPRKLHHNHSFSHGQRPWAKTGSIEPMSRRPQLYITGPDTNLVLLLSIEPARSGSCSNHQTTHCRPTPVIINEDVGVSLRCIDFGPHNQFPLSAAQKVSSSSLRVGALRPVLGLAGLLSQLPVEPVSDWLPWHPQAGFLNLDGCDPETKLTRSLKYRLRSCRLLSQANGRHHEKSPQSAAPELSAKSK